MDYLVSGLEMAELDRQAIQDLGIPGRVLMECAGRAVAEYCHRRLGKTGRIVVACGGGNNGGDGFVAARLLAERGHDVSVFVFADVSRIAGDAKANLATLKTAGGVRVVEGGGPSVLLELASALGGADLALDALLGTGLRDDVRGSIGEAIDLFNRESCPVVAVDVPSGIDADTGRVLGRGVEAVATVTFAFAKRGHYLHPGMEQRGELTVADIGIPASLAAKLGVVGRLIVPADGPGLVPPRRAASHKGHFGHLLVVAGSAPTPGAALLALGGALRSGAGLVSWSVDEATLAHAPSLQPEVMLRIRHAGDDGSWAERALEGATAVTAGPGLTTAPERVADLAALLSRATVPLCLDADALNILAQNDVLWSELRAPLVITPHPKEMARLAGTTVEQVQRDRFAAAAQLAMRRGCVVVLKGAGTVIADPDGAAAVVDAGNPGMATGGTGDVLAGVIGALLAQGIDSSTAARLGVLAHAVAGDIAAAKHGQAGMTATDVIEALSEVWLRWRR